MSAIAALFLPFSEIENEVPLKKGVRSSITLTPYERLRGFDSFDWLIYQPISSLFLYFDVSVGP